MPTSTKAAAKKSAADAFDPRVDLYINKAAPFARPILEHLRQLVHDNVPGVTEDIKWSHPFFVVDGKIFANMPAFKAHCSFGFWSPKMTELLTADGIDGTGSAGSLGKIASMEDLPADKVMAKYLKSAAKLMAAGEYGTIMPTAKPKLAKPELPAPPELTAALAKSKAAKANFEALPPSCKREYIEWISSAKRPETREKRLLEAVARITANRRMNDQYR